MSAGHDSKANQSTLHNTHDVHITHVEELHSMANCRMTSRNTIAKNVLQVVVATDVGQHTI